MIAREILHNSSYRYICVGFLDDDEEKFGWEVESAPILGPIDELPKYVAETGAEAAAVTLQRRADMRYLGQGFEIEVPLPDGPLGPGSRDEIGQRFLARYQELFDRRITAVPVEAMTWRLSATAPVPNIELNFAGQPAADGIVLLLESIREPRVFVTHGASPSCSGRSQKLRTLAERRVLLPDSAANPDATAKNLTTW